MAIFSALFGGGSKDVASQNTRARTAPPPTTPTRTPTATATPTTPPGGRNGEGRPRTGTAVPRETLGNPELPLPADVGTAANTAAQRARRRGLGANSLTGLASSVNKAAPLLVKKTLLAGGK